MADQDGDDQDGGQAPQGFADIKLSGGRYEQPGYPVSGLTELARYERLLIDVAKALWKQEHPNRERSPRGFTDRLQLRLIEIHEGSTVPVLEKSQYTLGVKDYMEEARRLVDEAFESIESSNSLSATFPDEASGGLVQIGGTFRGNEAFVFRASTATPVRYGRELRKRFLRSLRDKPYPVDTTMTGKITALDTDAQTFTLMVDQEAISGNYGDSAFSNDLKAVLNTASEADLVRIEATVLVDSSDRVTEVTEAWEVEVFLTREDAAANRLIELLSLRDGWLDGGGQVIEITVLEYARDLLKGIADRDVALPGIFPTDDGGIQLEWYWGGRNHLAIEIDHNLTVEACLVDADQNEGEVTALPDLDSAVQLVSQAVGGR